MIRKLTLFAILGILMAASAWAQPICGFDHAHQQQLLQSSSYSQSVTQQKNHWNQVMQAGQNSLIINTPNGPVYEIPVVIHVITTGGPIGSMYNPSVAQLTGMIDYLNKTYAATWASYPGPGNGGTYIPLRFVLAKRDPNCNPTTGIVRVDGSGVLNYTSGGIANSTSTGADEATVKALSIWPNTEYYNIWVVNKIDGQDGITGSGPFTAGYAYFPGAPASLDGTIMLASQAVAGQITLPHEVGHAFGIYHVFEGDNNGASCPANNNCNIDGDGICDTEPEKRSVFNCPADPNPCTNASFNMVQHNFMDYSSCQDRFTTQQGARIIANLLSDRPSLISSLGGVAPGAAVPATACIPTSSNPSNTSNAGPRGISFNDLNATSGGYNDDGNQVYLNKTCMQQANVIEGNTYTLSVQTGPSPEKVRVYIDYNNDGDFSDPGEAIYSHDGTQFYEVHSTSYTIPTTGITTCVPLRMRVVSDRSSVASVTACGPLGYGQAEDYSVVVRPAPQVPTIALTAGTNPSCNGTSLTFTAAAPSGTINPTFTWFLNGTAVSGASGPTFTSVVFNNNDVVTVKMNYTSGCGADSSFSTGITVQRASSVAPTVSAAITNGSNPGCSGQSLTFTATGTNTGNAPTYNWLVNGTSVSSGASNTFTTAALNSGDIVSCTMTSSSTCATPATASSNSIAISFSSSLVANVTISSAGNSICAGKPATFNATAVNGGTAPQLQWLVNNTAVSGATGNSFTSSSLANNDVVSCVLVSNSPCVTNTTDTSNSITVAVQPLDTTSITAAITSGANPGCLDSLLGFTATATNLGATPDISWWVNGSQVATGTSYASTTLQNNDVVVARGIATDGGCHTADTVYSSSITVVRGTPPAAPVISFISSNLVANTAPVQWYGPSGLIPGATGQVYHPTEPGLYYATALSSGCPSAASNQLEISLLSIGTLDMSTVKIYPNPSTGQVTLNWGNQSVRAELSVYNGMGQEVLQDAVNGQSVKTLNLSSLSNGVYFIRIKDQQGHVGVAPVTLNR